MSTNFVHLHNHTEYCFERECRARVRDIVNAAKDLGMSAVGITDYGGLFGAVEFDRWCRRERIKPVIGFEAFVAPQSRFDKKGKRDCLVLFASNYIGWKNLMKLSTTGYLDGFHKKPSIDMEVLRQHGEGIIATSGGIFGTVAQAIKRGDMNAAKTLACEYVSIFGEGNFYLELQDHGLESEKDIMRDVIELGRETGIPLVLTNDTHYARREDVPKSKLPATLSREMYFKSPEEMARLFPEVPEALTNTLAIADRCEVNIRKKTMMPPVVIPSEYENPGAYLACLARDGLKDRYRDVTPEIEARLAYELDIVNQVNIADRFLIMAEFMREMRRMGMSVCCSWITAASSLINYALGITDIDPIRYGLLFERFINPDRIAEPNFDIDFDDRDRQAILEYLSGKYGRDAVCRIAGNFEFVWSPIDLPREEGMVIAPGAITERVPLFKLDGNIMTQFNSDDINALGCFNIGRHDVLGHRALSVSRNTLRFIKRYRGEELNLWELPDNDEKTFALLNAGKTAGVFIFAPDCDKKYERTLKPQYAFKEYLLKLKPSCIEDLIALYSLHRCGLLGRLDMLIERKHGGEEIKYVHPIIKDILDETYGVLVYREQLMRIVQEIGGLTPGESAILCVASGKLELRVIETMLKKITLGAHERGIEDAAVMEWITEHLTKLGPYCFAKSLAVVAVTLSYQCAYLKAHYPLEFTAGYLAAFTDGNEEFTAEMMREY